DDTNFDTLMVGGSALVGSLTPGVINFLRQGLLRSRRVASTCTGAFVLAEAGLLDGRRATTHWHRARDLRTRFPKVKVEEDRIFIIDGPVGTSAGMTAGIDLALAMTAKDLGADVGGAARLRWERSRQRVGVIARETGFADRDRMRRAFRRAFGQAPQVLRRNARAQIAA